MSDENEIYYGSCEHPLTEDWFNSEESTYLRLDQATGMVVTVTTCEECKENAENHNLIMDEAEVELDLDDLLYNPFANDPAPDKMVVIDTDGTTYVVDMDKEE